jgi:hypothetical protein
VRWKLVTSLLLSCWLTNDLFAQSPAPWPTMNMPSPLPTVIDSNFADTTLAPVTAADPRITFDSGVTLRRWTEAERAVRESHASTDDVSWRLRRFSVRERRLSGFSGASLVVWDEDYLDSRDRGWGTESAFEQNRTFAGLKWRLTPDRSSHLEFGYLNQTWDDPGQDDRRFHFLSLNFYF